MHYKDCIISQILDKHFATCNAHLELLIHRYSSYYYHFFLQVIAESLSEEEIGGLRELFKMIDADNSGTITFDELKDGLKRVGSELTEHEIQALMDAVGASLQAK